MKLVNILKEIKVTNNIEAKHAEGLLKFLNDNSEEFTQYVNDHILKYDDYYVDDEDIKYLPLDCKYDYDGNYDIAPNSDENPEHIGISFRWEVDVDDAKNYEELFRDEDDSYQVIEFMGHEIAYIKYNF